MRKFTEIAIGSKSVHKINALETALKFCGIDNIKVVGYAADSGVNEQPFGLEETTRGALNRATNACSNDCSNVIRVGIESGIIRTPNAIFDIAIVAVIVPGYKTFFATSPGIEFPSEYVEEAERKGFKTTTVGSVIATHLGGDKTDPHAELTGGRIKRKGTLVEALKTVFAQIIEYINNVKK